MTRLNRLPPRAGWLTLVAAVGCMSANAETADGSARTSKREGKPPVAASVGGMSESLRKSAGNGPVLLALTDAGVEARSADGAFKTLIVPGPVDRAVYDPGLELLWVRRHHHLDVWDLREEKPKAIPILADTPDNGDFDIVRGDHHVGPGGMCNVPGSMNVHWSQHPSVEILGFDEMDSPPHPRLAGAAWLTREFGRKPRNAPVSVAPLPGSATKEARVAIPRAVGRCSDPDDCGRGVPFGSTGWTLLVAAEDPGADCQHYRCLLRDPQKKTFGKPPMPEKWNPAPQKSMLYKCGLYRFEAGGKWFAIEDQVCAVGGTCSTMGKSADAISWLDGENDVGTDN